MTTKFALYSISIALIICSMFGINLLLKKNSISFENSLVVGTHAEYYPFEFVENDTIQGFDIDLIEAIAHKLGKTLRIKNVPFDSLIPAMQVGSIQIVASGMTPTEDRAKRVLFSKPYFGNDPLLIVTHSNNTTIKNVKDLVGKTVVVNQGYTADFYISKIDGVDIKRLQTVTDAFLALEAGQAKALVTAQSSAQPFFKKHGTQQFKVVPLEGTEETYALAISPKHPSLLKVIQEALDALEKDGTLTKLKTKWKLQ